MSRRKGGYYYYSTFDRKITIDYLKYLLVIRSFAIELRIDHFLVVCFRRLPDLLTEGLRSVA